jgi:acyl-CoA synthetase (AMP-forming)/AMP-acid ligase II
MFGAPVPGVVLDRFRRILPNGQTFTPYGATEALFVASISGDEVCEETYASCKEGKGTCVGRVIPGIELKIIRITDDAITLPSEGIDTLEVPQGTIGEIVVKGPYVTREYYNMPQQTAKAKIYDGDAVWHRMGDLGYFDEVNRLWFVGRKSHRLTRDGQEYYNAMVEGYFNQIEGVARSAMVGVCDPAHGQRIVMIIQLAKNKGPKIYRNTKARLNTFQTFADQINLPVDAFLFSNKIPVDIRHNAKIKNDVLGLWAEKKLRGKFRP